MAEQNQNTSANGRFHFQLLVPFLFRPRSIFPQVLARKATWFTPLLIVSLVFLGQAIFIANRSGAAPVEPIEPPMESAPFNGSVTILTGGGGGGGGGYGSGMVDDGTGAVSTSPTMAIALAAGKKIGSLWLGWLVLTALLYVVLVISGGQSTFTQALNLTAWSSLPFAIQSLAQIIFSLAYPDAANIPQGLAGLFSQAQGTGGVIATLIFQNVTVFLLWQAILISIGITFVSHIPLRKAAWLVVIAFVIYLVLAAMPGFAMSQLSILQNAASPQY